LSGHAGWSELLASQLIAVLCCSCSCLVSFSPSKLGQFSFESCPFVQRISSEIHYLPCFGGGLLLCLFTGISELGAYFLAPPPFSGAGCVPPAPLLSMFYYCSLFFSFSRNFSFGCCSLVQEMISVIHYLPCFGEWLIAHLLSVFTAFPVSIY
jgi:hypothetical protein